MSTTQSYSESLSDEFLQLITGQIFIGQAILAAHEIGLFRLLRKKGPLPISTIAMHLGVNERAAQAMVSCSGSHHLVEHTMDGYRLSELGFSYFDEEGSEDYGKVLDLLIQESEIMNYASIKETILSGCSRTQKLQDLFSNDNNLSNTKSFIESLHYKALKPAFFWSKKIDLKNYKKFIDIGGGSGVHTIAACLAQPELTGTVCERQSVIPFTQEFIRAYDLENRIETTSLDMWEDPFPEGDVYFFGDIFHDWDREDCLFLAKKCYELLPKNGLLVAP